jgi:hypothetical protein
MRHEGIKDKQMDFWHLRQQVFQARDSGLFLRLGRARPQRRVKLPSVLVKGERHCRVLEVEEEKLDDTGNDCNVALLE